MIDRSTNIQAALRSRQRGFLLNPFRFAPSGSADPYWSQVQLLLHFDGANGSTTFTDSSASPKSAAASGSAIISTAQSRFGGSSLQPRVASAGHCSVAHAAAFDVATGDWCIEFFSYAQDMSANAILFNKASGTASGYPFQGLLTSAGAITFRSFNASSVQVFSTTTANGVVSLKTWHHLAFCRVGTDFYVFVDGVMRASTTYAGTLPSNTETLSIGAYSNSSYPFIGHIDELRFTVGNGRYPAAFSPPTAPFPNY